VEPQMMYTAAKAAMTSARDGGAAGDSWCAALTRSSRS
jgi:hypothetical protein